MPPPTYRVLVSGATGLVGRALVASLRVPKGVNGFNPQVSRLVRTPPTPGSPDVWWDGEARIDVSRLEGFDAVVHLAGENVGSGDGPLAALGRWSVPKKHAILESRRRGTGLLSAALAACARPPAVFVTASGVGYYGSRGDDVLTENASQGAGFLAEVAGVWEGATAPAKAAGIRTVHARFGMVLSGSGGALAKMLPPFRLGLGGPVGPGTQWVPWVALDDAVRAVETTLHTPSLSGPVNVCAPPVTNAQLTAALGAAVGMPAVIPLPSFVVEALFGEMGRETLLASTRAVPSKLDATPGWRWLHPEITEAMKWAVTHG